MPVLLFEHGFAPRERVPCTVAMPLSRTRGGLDVWHAVVRRALTAVLDARGTAQRHVFFS